jgi:hypothetical protein
MHTCMHVSTLVPTAHVRLFRNAASYIRGHRHRPSYAPLIFPKSAKETLTAALPPTSLCLPPPGRSGGYFSRRRGRSASGEEVNGGCRWGGHRGFQSRRAVGESVALMVDVHGTSSLQPWLTRLLFQSSSTLRRTSSRPCQIWPSPCRRVCEHGCSSRIDIHY